MHEIEGEDIRVTAEYDGQRVDEGLQDELQYSNNGNKPLRAPKVPKDDRHFESVMNKQEVLASDDQKPSMRPASNYKSHAYDSNRLVNSRGEKKRILRSSKSSQRDQRDNNQNTNAPSMFFYKYQYV